MVTATAQSAAAQVRAWIDALPEGTPFRLHALPVPAKTSTVEMSRLAADPDSSGVKRLRRGVFLKGRRVRGLQDHPEAAEPWVWSFVPDNSYQLVRWYLRSAGYGLGYAGMHALHKVGLIDQVPVNTELVVLGRAPPSPVPEHIFIRSRWNQRRKALFGAEISIIEAARFSWFLSDDALAPYVARFALLGTTAHMGDLAHLLPVWDYVIRPDMLRWVVETENCEHASLVKERVNWFADLLPGELRYERHWPRGHLLRA